MFGVRDREETHELTRGSFENFSNGAFQDILAALPKSQIHTSDLTVKMGLEWSPSDGHLWYASYSRGANSGGLKPPWNPTTVEANVATARQVGQEERCSFNSGGKQRRPD